MEWRRNIEEARRWSLWCHSEIARERDTEGKGKGDWNRVCAADESVRMESTGLVGRVTAGQDETENLLSESRGGVRRENWLGEIAVVAQQEPCLYLRLPS